MFDYGLTQLIQLSLNRCIRRQHVFLLVSGNCGWYACFADIAGRIILRKMPESSHSACTLELLFWTGYTCRKVFFMTIIDWILEKQVSSCVRSCTIPVIIQSSDNADMSSSAGLHDFWSHTVLQTFKDKIQVVHHADKLQNSCSWSTLFCKFLYLQSRQSDIYHAKSKEECLSDSSVSLANEIRKLFSQPRNLTSPLRASITACSRVAGVPDPACFVVQFFIIS